jgi:hypothetical protein
MENSVARSWYVSGIELCVSVVPLLDATVFLFGFTIVQPREVHVDFVINTAVLGQVLFQEL